MYQNPSQKELDKFSNSLKYAHLGKKKYWLAKQERILITIFTSIQEKGFCLPPRPNMEKKAFCLKFEYMAWEEGQAAVAALALNQAWDQSQSLSLCPLPTSFPLLSLLPSLCHAASAPDTATPYPLLQLQFWFRFWLWLCFSLGHGAHSGSSACPAKAVAVVGDSASSPAPIQSGPEVRAGARIVTATTATAWPGRD